MSFATAKTVLVTGAAGNLGRKLCSALFGRYSLRLLDLQRQHEPRIEGVDLSVWSEQWVKLFSQVDVVVHLAGNPVATADWADLIGPNVDAMINTYEAAAQAGVQRFIFASSNHVMGGYQHSDEKITPQLSPRPGATYLSAGQMRNSNAYAVSKLFGERLGASYAKSHQMSVLAVRIGWVWRGDNSPAGLPADRAQWFRKMWLSDRDFVHLMERCIEAPLEPGSFAIVNGMSNNARMRWDISQTRELLGYVAKDDVEG